jgi:hypothetical protein
MGDRWSNPKLVGVGALLVVLIVQGVIDFRSTTEAFPTVSMPSFEGAPDRQGHRTVTKLTIQVEYSDGTVTEPEPESLFEQFHYSSARYSIDYVLKSPSPLDPETVEWLREQCARVGGGADPASVRFTWQQYDLDVEAVDGVPVGEPITTEVAL